MATREATARGLIACFGATLALVGCGPSAAGTLVRSVADLNCSLPIHTDDHVGFVDFPSGQYREDRSVTPGLATNNFGLFYDKPAHRWINAGGGLGDQYFSPNGGSVAFVNVGPVGDGPDGVVYQGFTDVYLLNVASLRWQHVAVMPGNAALIGFRPNGLYFNDGGTDSNGTPIKSGVYRLDLSTGQSVRVGPNGAGSSTALNLWNRVTSAAVWGSLLAIPNQYDANPIQSMSFADGRVTRWYTAPPTRSAAIVGFVGPLEPLVAEFDTFSSLQNLRFMILTAPNVVKPVNIDPSTSGFGLTDRYGIWLGAPGRLSLYDSAGLISMADLSHSPIASEIPVIAGRCS